MEKIVCKCLNGFGEIMIQSFNKIKAKGILGSVNEIKKVSLEGIDTIIIFSNSIDLHVYKSDTDEFVAHLLGNTNAAGTLMWDTRTEKNVLYVDLKIIVGRAKFCSYHLDVSIPSKKFKKLVFKSLTSDISYADLYADEIEVISKAGDIYCKGEITSEIMKIESAVGEIEVGEYVQAENLTLLTSTTNIKTLAKYSNLYCVTNTGKVNIECKLIQDTEMKIESNTGAISIKLSNAKKLDMKFNSSIGDFKKLYEECEEGYNAKIEVSTYVGDLLIE